MTVYSIPKDFYIEVQKYIIETYRDEFPGGVIPMVGLEGVPYIERIPYLTEYDVSMGVLDLNAGQAKAEAGLAYLDVAIHGRQMKLAFTARDLRRSGADVINAKNKVIISKFLSEVDEAVWHGNTEGAVAVGLGLVSQLTDVNAVITEAQTSGEVVFQNMRAMVMSIASKYRSRFPIVLLMDYASYDLAVSEIATGFTVSAMEVFKKAYPNVEVIATDTILATGDVAGTNGRMIAFAQNEDLVRIAMAQLPGPAGPAIVSLTGSIEQLWASFWGVKVIQSTATAYTGTTLTFA